MKRVKVRPYRRKNPRSKGIHKVKGHTRTYSTISKKNITRNDDRVSFNYEMDNHRGSISTTGASESQIAKAVSDIDELIGLTKEIFERYPAIRDFYDEIPENIENTERYQKPYANIVLDSDVDRNFGMGVSDIGHNSFKVFWYSPEESRDELSDRYLSGTDLASTPAVAVPHEFQHVMGSSKEFSQPLAETVGTVFYLQNDEYCLERQQKNAVMYLVKDYLRNSDDVRKSQIEVLYDYAPNRADEILRDNLHSQDYEKIRRVIDE